MLRWIAYRLLLLLVLTGRSAAQGQPLVFSATGDIPYGSSEIPILQKQIQDHNRYSPSEFIVHVGDIKSGSDACSESRYQTVADLLQAFAVPTFVLPGDNEWNDCSSPSQAWSYWTRYFDAYDARFCSHLPVERQSVRHENFAFVHKGVLVVGINLVGGRAQSSSEWTTRLGQDADWVQQQMTSHRSEVRAAVVFGHAGPGASQHQTFFTRFRSASASFGKPVLYVHGDGHNFVDDHPWPESNMRRVEVNNGGSEPPLQITAGMDATNPFQVKRNPWSSSPTVFNMPPCVQAGPDRTVDLPGTVALQGSGTDDGDPSPASLGFAWSRVSGPGNVHFGNVAAAATTASFDVAGTYVLRLTASDGALQSSDDVRVDARGGTPMFSISDATVLEGHSGTASLSFNVTLTGGTGATAHVHYATAPGTASADVDYVSTNGSLDFSGSTTSRQVTVLVRGDTELEPDETVFVDLSQPSGGALGDARGEGKIVNDDSVQPPPPGPPTIAGFAPASGPPGSAVVIDGTQFVNVTTVKFGGVVASFAVNSTTRLTANVPSGATSGRIVVTTGAGACTSGTDFTVTEPLPSSATTFLATDDSYVKGPASSSNFGSETTLRVRGGTSIYKPYLKFLVEPLASGPVSATLRLYVVTAGLEGGKVYSVANTLRGSTTPWTEGTILGTNAPSITGAPLASRGTVSTGWVEFDVSAAIVGPGTYSFAMESDTDGSVYYSSSEGAQPPQLVVTPVTGTSSAAAVAAKSADSSLYEIRGFELLRRYPNPSPGTATFEYRAARPGLVQLDLYTVSGARLRRLTRAAGAGTGWIDWDGRDDSGLPVGSGIYLYELRFESARHTGKLVVRR